MNIQAQIEVLKSLAALDAELSTLGDVLSSEQKALAGKRTLLAELDDRVKTSASSLQEMDKVRGALVAEMRQMSLQIDRAREKLSRCRNEREANAATRELEELRKLYRDREHEIEKLVSQAGETKGDVEVTSQRRAEVAGELGESEGQSSEKISELEKSSAERLKKREEMAKTVDPSIYRKYELVRKHRGSGLAAVGPKGNCTACHISLPPMLFQQIMYHRGLHQCPSCHRVLYFEAPRAQDDADKSGADGADPEASVNQAG